LRRDAAQTGVAATAAKLMAATAVLIFIEFSFAPAAALAAAPAATVRAIR
jgi:hypothetical protein